MYFYLITSRRLPTQIKLSCINKNRLWSPPIDPLSVRAKTFPFHPRRTLAAPAKLFYRPLTPFPAVWPIRPAEATAEAVLPHKTLKQTVRKYILLFTSVQATSLYFTLASCGSNFPLSTVTLNFTKSRSNTANSNQFFNLICNITLDRCPGDVVGKISALESEYFLLS